MAAAAETSVARIEDAKCQYRRGRLSQRDRECRDRIDEVTFRWESGDVLDLDLEQYHEAPAVPGMPSVHPGSVLEEILLDHG
jgi:hypothetical protein